MIEIKKITEGMTGQQVSDLLYENFLAVLRNYEGINMDDLSSKLDKDVAELRVELYKFMNNVIEECFSDELMYRKLCEFIQIYFGSDNDYIGKPNGFAQLDENGLIPPSQLPSYVDDVLEGYYVNTTRFNKPDNTTAYEPETGKIYVDISNDSAACYRWSGSTYILISTAAGGITEVPVASSTTLGGIKIGYTTAGKNYKVSVDANGNAYVNVPWTNTSATTTAAGLMSSSDKSKLDTVEESANKYIHPTYTARTGKPTANQTPGFGDTVTITQVVSDNQGHVSGMTDRTIKIPNAVATQESAGLMSAEDKIRLDGVTGSNVVITTSDEYTAMQAAGTLDDNTVYFLKG